MTVVGNCKMTARCHGAFSECFLVAISFGEDRYDGSSRQ